MKSLSQVGDLIDKNLLDKLENGSKALLTAVVANNPKFKDLKTLLEGIEKSEEMYTQLKDKLETFLKTDNTLSEPVNSVMTQLSAFLGDIANVSGPAGCGKTRMAETVCDLFNDSGLDAVFFAFHHKNHNDPKMCIETLAYSIAEKYNTPSDREISKLIFSKCEGWENDPAKKPVDLAGLVRDLLVTPLKNKRREVVLVIDALDECDSKSLQQFLKILGSPAMSRQFRLFVTSREPAKLQNAEEYIFESKSEENISDLQAYVQGKLDLKTIIPRPQREVYATELVAASQGNFLIASLALNVLEEDFIQYNLFANKWNKLMSTELTSDLLYERIWSRVEVTNVKDQIEKLVGIMITLKRPLSVEGLAKIMDIDTGPLQTMITHIVPMLKDICTVNDFVQFKHKTAVEFFEKRVPLQSNFLAEKSMQFIGSWLRPLNSSERSKAMYSLVCGTNKYQFSLESDATLYFIENWAATFNAATHFDEVTFNQFAVNYGYVLLAASIKMQNEAIFMVLVQYESLEALVHSELFSSPVLYEAAKHGLASVCKCLLESKRVDVNCIGYTPSDDPTSGEWRKTPLHVAVLLHHLELVKVLVEHDANIGAKDGYGRTPLTYSLGPVYQFLNSIITKRQEKMAVETMTNLQRAIHDNNLELFKKLHTDSAMMEKNIDDKHNTGFHYLALYANPAMLSYFVKLSSFEVSVYLVNSDNATPLSLAAEKGNIEAVKALLRCGANIEAKDNDRSTPLIHASSQGHTEIVEILLECGANIEFQNRLGYSALAYAALKGNFQTVNLLLNCGASIESTNSNGDTPATLAAAMGHTETLRLLIACGATIESKEDDGYTLLALAALNGHQKTAELLLEYGANIESKDNFGRTPLALTGLYGYKETAKLLLGRNAKIESRDRQGFTPLAMAAGSGFKETVELFLECGANIEVKNNEGCTPLILAAGAGLKETVEAFLDCGAQIEAKDRDGWTPLLHAVCKGHIDIVNLLLDHAANIETTNNNGDSALAVAAAYGQTEITDLLLKNGANLENQNNIGCTPLAIAARNGQKETVEFLINSGASIDSKDKKGWSSLFYAVETGQIGTVRLLLQRGANIDLFDNDGRTALANTASEGNYELVELLVQFGANVVAQDMQGFTPLLLAIQNRHEDTVALFRKYGAPYNEDYEFI
ncbi:hypothetical protein HDU79_010109 [Rhizoclosmatium sp. JEL0117]|nr:hypothetical protein HDU79_010109 [Rhizoclosmatium sp. JEL0117]